MKNKLKSLVDLLFGNIKRKTVTILSINIIIMVVMLIVGAAQFETVDDYMIYELLSGKWENATEYVVYINIYI